MNKMILVVARSIRVEGYFFFRGLKIRTFGDHRDLGA